jgi:putative endonuclease
VERSVSSHRDFWVPLEKTAVCHLDPVERSQLLPYLYKMKKTIGTHNYYVYILTNKTKKVLYIGVTNNLINRLYYHSTPEANSKHFTHKYNCNYLIYFEQYQCIETAIEREKQLKRWSRSKKEVLINSLNPDWNFLNDTI